VSRALRRLPADSQEEAPQTMVRRRRTEVGQRSEEQLLSEAAETFANAAVTAADDVTVSES